MNKNLGNITVLILFFLTILDAKDLEYKLSVDKKDPFVKEVVILQMNLTQVNKKIVLMYDFDLVKSENYDFKRVEATESDIDHNSKAHYTYLIYPLKSGEIDINFKLVKKVTTDENLAYSFSGDRDNVKGLVTTDTKIDITTLKLNVKPIPDGTKLVGDFKLNYILKSKNAASYEPLTMNITIEGEGYPPHFKEFPIKSNGFKIFADKPITKVATTKESITSKTEYPLAFSSKKSFTLEKISIKAYNTKTQKSYFLSIPEQQINIREIEPKELIDKTDNPKAHKNYIHQIQTSLEDFFGYIIVFLAGTLSGYFLKFKKKKPIIKEISEKEKIKSTKNTKELLIVLISIDAKKYEIVIKKCENSLYNDKKINFSSLKKEALNFKV